MNWFYSSNPIGPLFRVGNNLKLCVIVKCYFFLGFFTKKLTFWTIFYNTCGKRKYHGMKISIFLQSFAFVLNLILNEFFKFPTLFLTMWKKLVENVQSNAKVFRFVQMIILINITHKNFPKNRHWRNCSNL